MKNNYYVGFGEKIPLSEHFGLHEFKCSSADVTFVDAELVEKLEALRAKAGAPIYITSGYRTPEHNKKVGGASKSQHMLGKAADIHVKTMTASALAKLAVSVGFNGVILYKDQGFVHVDVRPVSQKYISV